MSLHKYKKNSGHFSLSVYFIAIDNEYEYIYVEEELFDFKTGFLIWTSDNTPAWFTNALNLVFTFCIPHPRNPVMKIDQDVLLTCKISQAKTYEEENKIIAITMIVLLTIMVMMM